jgi:hypothetical protein
MFINHAYKFIDIASRLLPAVYLKWGLYPTIDLIPAIWDPIICAHERHTWFNIGLMMVAKGRPKHVAKL